MPEPQYLQHIASFLRADDPAGQMSLFPYRFDVIPVELISSIYEQFLHSSEQQDDGASLQGFSISDSNSPIIYGFSGINRQIFSKFRH
ncbi:MAG: hypothetical protein OXF84_12960, partial [Bacteroidetes bacterium]|nr:hypothetical protein [Bacteroidota bacterium]